MGAGHLGPTPRDGGRIPHEPTAGTRQTPLTSGTQEPLGRATLTVNQNPEGSFFLTEWEQVILARHHETAPKSLTSPRPGRGSPLSRPVRKSLWAAVERLTADLAANDHATHLQIA